ncbi:MAG: hypothetical protein KQJ78_24505 [Deltaproteobacteria bacterium]|nr:hypothetical protein [Deltaproteobacteria bacterium]
MSAKKLAFGLLCLLVLTAAPVQGNGYSWQTAFEPWTTPWAGDFFDFDAALTDISGGIPTSMTVESASFDLLWHELLREENLGRWREFQGGAATVIPVTAIRIFRLSDEPFTALAASQRLAEQRYSLSPRSSSPTAAQWHVPILGMDTAGEVEFQGNMYERGPWNPLTGWLFYGDGLFSAREWSWENFLPRALTIVGLLLGGLMMVEFLRVVLLTGLRFTRGGRRRRP